MPPMVTSWRSRSTRHVADAAARPCTVGGVDRPGPAAAHHGAHPGHQLPHPVRLGHVVVRADLQPNHSVDLLPAGRHHDHRRVGDRADAAAHVDPGQSGQHHVEQHDLGFEGLEHGQGLLAVGGDVDDEPLGPQRHLQALPV